MSVDKTSVDERAIGALIEEAGDLHHDAMRTTRGSLRELVEIGRETGADHEARVGARPLTDVIA